MKLKKVVSLLLAFAAALTVIPSGTSALDFSDIDYEAAETRVYEKEAASAEMRGLTAFQLVSDMGPGWNLGNSLEVNSTDETYWGNPVTTKAMIDAVAAKGFKTLRIPVRWDMHYTDSSYTIDTNYLKRVEEVVNYGLSNDMYVIINIHHNDIQTMVSTDSSTQTRVCNEMKAVWTQVGNYFKNYGDKLIFETINEPRHDEDWGGTSAYYDCVNKYNEAGRAAIRATGGNNASRLIMMPTYCASADAPKVEGWKKLASDNMVAVSIHAYLPFDFAFEGTGHSDWLESDYTSLSGVFATLNSNFISKGIPVVIGEFGACNKSNTSHRATYAKTYASLARQFAEQSIPCIWWDNNCFGTGAENFGLFNRSSLSFTYDSVASALINAYSGNPPYETVSSGEQIIFSGSSSCSGFGQAFDTTDLSFLLNMKSGDKLYAKYSSSNAPEAIFHKESPFEWIKVAPDSDSNGVAVWSYETLLNAAGGSFSGVFKFYIGDTGSALTLTKLYIPTGAAHTHNYNGTSSITLPATTTTCGLRKVCCSVSGCSAYKVEVVPKVTVTVEEDEIADFVERLYVKLLGRASDPKGKANHINRLKSGVSACDVVKLFALSTELANKKLSNKEFVTRMYNTMLDRNPDAGGLARWTAALDNGCSYGYVLQGFGNSAEFTRLCASYGIVKGSYTSPENRDKNANLTAYVSRMYTKALGRKYDVTGLNNHTGRYLAGTKNAKDIAYSFIFSAEFKNKNLTDEQFVDTLYQALFNRNADAGGKSRWLTKMKNGMTREQVFSGFASSAEFKNMVAGFGI
ncbi:MAG: cellulase family glycosylhydrolase [Huintestinicola sp.]|uniref:cellulase family glycosylhydrolase n=1 Tax=Huintestinicola sp. TaxID=2981661 RepID=UPI003F052018